MGDRLRRMAKLILSEMGIDRPPIDVIAVAAYLGLMVLPIDDALCRLVGLDPSDASSIAGMLVWGEGLTIAAVNVSHNLTRQRFTLAHEIAHYLLSPSPGIHLMHRERVSYLESERQCNRFAAEVLMPAHMVLPRLAENPCFLTLCSEFGVSKRAMSLRMSEVAEIA